MFKEILIFIILFSSSVYSAEISGKVYDSNLNLAKNSIVEINTKPLQRYVAKDGSYILNVKEGSYIIKASLNGNYDETNLEVKSDGKYVYDFILFPSVKDEEELINTGDVDFNIPEEKSIKAEYYYWIILIILIAFYIFRKKRAIIKFFLRRRLKEEKDELNGVIEIIKKNDGRIIQKDLRKELNLSEAKVSLMITELESKGIVKKIKKGRGNIIILLKQ